MTIFPGKKAIFPGKRAILPGKIAIFPRKRAFVPGEKAIFRRKMPIFPGKIGVFRRKKGSVPGKIGSFPRKKGSFPGKTLAFRRWVAFFPGCETTGSGRPCDLAPRGSSALLHAGPCRCRSSSLFPLAGDAAAAAVVTGRHRFILRAGSCTRIHFELQSFRDIMPLFFGQRFIDAFSNVPEGDQHDSVGCSEALRAAALRKVE